MGDLLCSNYEAAAINREIVRLKQKIIGYIEVEEMVRNWPRKKLLPERLLGNLPEIHRNEAWSYGMNKKEYLNSLGMHVIDNFNG